ncbi:MAG TPA: hypothetical protein VGL10_07030 [Gammaproteobacteria bacterium]
MRVKGLLLTMIIIPAVARAHTTEIEPLSLEFLEFLGENAEQDGWVELLLTAETEAVPAGAETGVNDDE